MIIEIADIRVKPEDTAVFSEAITRAASTVLAKSQGYSSHFVLSSIETPGRFILQVEWETLEAHTVGFRQSPAFADWRAIIGPFFAQPPQVEHFERISGS